VRKLQIAPITFTYSNPNVVVKASPPNNIVGSMSADEIGMKANTVESNRPLVNSSENDATLGQGPNHVLPNSNTVANYDATLGQGPNHVLPNSNTVANYDATLGQGPNHVLPNSNTVANYDATLSREPNHVLPSSNTVANYDATLGQGPNHVRHNSVIDQMA